MSDEREVFNAERVASMSAERIAELKRTLIGLPTTEWDAHIAQALSASTPMPGAACEHPPEACRHIEENGAYSYVRHGTWCSACGALNTGTWKSPSPPASPRVEPDRREYAEEVARCVRLALSSPVSRKAGEP